MPARTATPVLLLVTWICVTRAARSVPAMSDTSSSQPSDAEREYTEELPDGSPSGDATEDPSQDSDHDSGGEPEEPQAD